MIESVSFLERPAQLKEEIQNDVDNLAMLRSVVEKVTINLSYTAGCSSSKEAHAFESTMVDIQEEEEKIWKKVELLKEVLLETADAINRLSSEKERRLLKLRYLEEKTWYEISVELQVNDRYIHALHRKALRSMDALLNQWP